MTATDNHSVSPVDENASHFTRLLLDLASLFFVAGSGALAISPLSALSIALCLLYIFLLVVLTSESGRSVFSRIMSRFGYSLKSNSGDESDGVVSVVVMEEEQKSLSDNSANSNGDGSANGRHESGFGMKVGKESELSGEMAQDGDGVEMEKSVATLPTIARERSDQAHSPAIPHASNASKVQAIDGIEVYLDQVLGNGSKGTIVFAGSFQGTF
jgi:hypothetical protein